MIDIHTHLLPGVDDGSPSIEASLPILRRFGNSGVDTVVCTPHLEASRADSAPHARHRDIFDRLCAAAPAVPRLLLGWEIMLDVPGVDLTDPRLALGGSSAVLVEFPARNLPPNTTRELARLRDSGVVPVVAHPERYRPCGPALVAEWRDVGAVIQMDVPAVFGSKRLSEFAEQLLAHGLIDIFASDTHADARSLELGRRWLSAVASPDVVHLLTTENARRLLANEPLAPVPAIHLRHGMLERLRGLVFGRP
jgi:protein-tyrosine phosphatase